MEIISTTANTDGPRISSYGPGAVALIIFALRPSNYLNGNASHNSAVQVQT